MNIVKLEIKMAMRSLISYTISIIAVFSIFLFFFDSFKEGAELMDTLLKNFPPEFKAAFGFSDVNLSEFNGYMSFLFSYVVLIGAVYAMKLGVSVLSEEERVKTSDFLISKPVKRYQIVNAKFASVMILIVLQNIVSILVMWILSSSFIQEEFSAVVFFLMSGSMFLVQLFFIGVGLLLSVVLRKLKNVMPITLGVVFVFFIIELVNQSLMDAKIAYLTPFAYYKGSYIIANHAYPLKYVVVNLLVFFVLTACSYVVYHKKDVHSV